MNKLMISMIALFLGVSAMAAEGHEPSLQETCKAECPKAQTEHEAHECMKKVAETKKDDKKFRKSDCFAALKDHEKHEKEHGHKH